MPEHRQHSLKERGGWYAYGWSRPGDHTADHTIEGVSEEFARTTWHGLTRVCCRAVLMHGSTVIRDFKRDDYTEPFSSDVGSVQL